MSEKAPYKLAILNNLITPYRVPIYKRLGDRIPTYLLLSGQESNRDTWSALEEKLPNISIRKVWGVTLQFFERRQGKAFDPRYLHINPGYFYELLRIRPDAVISAEMGFRSLAALLYGFIARKPVWILWGGTLLTEQKRGLLKKLIRHFVFKRVTRWISYGETTTEYLVEGLGVARSHILQIQNCVDESQFIDPHIPVSLTLSPSPVLLYTGQLIQRKGIDLFLKAAAKVQQQGYVFSILIVGSGIEKESLVDLSTHLNLDDVTILPAQPPEAMPSIYKSADVLVFPTREDVWGLVVNEALWSGLPVIASKYAGCASEILPIENIFDPLDSAAFERLLIKAVTGKLAPPSVEPLYPCAQVVDMIFEEVSGALSLRGEASNYSKQVPQNQ
ncbi:glycosyltransferase family 4 protein [cf. Phormidesmis sp. LEGE 11477]|uniref:glycosyltransferase family 4 protein n=1 Tax=cf. Phormidesmis sp. LEGE 11477 TaxID=1828680 RepID=UPI0018820725|nr:glycosyltransferase family 4 protein [cf. Phormidesmis sp. LEGE 11477]MBE9063605.1 glycosyltransferase family 4 protein [cf. Phormidesmis sp. LEGE 11477]